MVQYGLDIPVQVRGFFTLEKSLLDLTLAEIEDRVGYQKGRLRQGADFFILTPPQRTADFSIMATSVFPGHKLDGSKLFLHINSEEKKKEHLILFKRKRLIKVAPLQLHLEALRPHLSIQEYTVVKEVSSLGYDVDQIIREIKRRFSNNSTLVAQIEAAFATRNDIFKRTQQDGTDDILYPSALRAGVPQWKLQVPVLARCVCRITEYNSTRYQRVF